MFTKALKIFTAIVSLSVYASSVVGIQWKMENLCSEGTGFFSFDIGLNTDVTWNRTFIPSCFIRITTSISYKSPCVMFYRISFDNEKIKIGVSSKDIRRHVNRKDITYVKQNGTFMCAGDEKILFIKVQTPRNSQGMFSMRIFLKDAIVKEKDWKITDILFKVIPVFVTLTLICLIVIWSIGCKLSTNVPDADASTNTEAIHQSFSTSQSSSKPQYVSNESDPVNKKDERMNVVLNENVD